MKYIFLLPGDFVELAKEEVLSLFDINSYILISKLLIADLGNNEREIKTLSKRLALTKNIFRFLFECKLKDLIDVIKKFDWNSVYKDSFCLRVHYLYKNSTTKKSINEKNNKKNKKIQKKYLEKDLAKYIWRSLKKPKVNLENPKTLIEIFIINGKAYCGMLVLRNNENFELRKSHLRPFLSPSSLHPKIARALVNIIGIKENEILLDPFCGTGGFLIEAGLMSIKVVGYDINRNIAKGCKENLKHFGITKYKIVSKNALNINNKFDYLVTDLPYGLNSNVYLQYNKNSLRQNKLNKINLKTDEKFSISRLENFYLKFLRKLRKIMNGKAVIIFPDYVNYKSLLEKSNFKIENEFSIYVHRSLTRKIVKIL